VCVALYMLRYACMCDFARAPMWVLVIVNGCAVVCLEPEEGF